MPLRHLQASDTGVCGHEGPLSKRFRCFPGARQQTLAVAIQTLLAELDRFNPSPQVSAEAEMRVRCAVGTRGGVLNFPAGAQDASLTARIWEGWSAAGCASRVSRRVTRVCNKAELLLLHAWT